VTTVNLENLKSGMILASDAVLLNGRILLRSGAELSDKSIKMFASWGLTEANIEGISETEIKSDAMRHLDNELLAKAEVAVREMFKFTNIEFPPITELYRICIKEHTEKLAGVSDNELDS